jgi:hypothetical protein
LISEPARTLTTLGPALVFGLGATHRLAGPFRLREDVRIAMHDEGPDLVVSIGLASALGRDVTRRHGQSARVGQATLRTGQRVWIVDENGRHVDGIVGDINAGTLEVWNDSGRSTLDPRHAQRIEIPDSIADGIRNGALIGAAGLGVFGGLLSTSICECDDGTAVLIAMALSGYGAATGALVGALSDSLHVGRRAILDRPTGATISLAPMVRGHGAGAMAEIRW